MSYLGSACKPVTTFYGYKMDTGTGKLTVEVIDDNVQTIKIPDPSNISPTDYRDYFWEERYVNFRWGTNGHLEAVIT